MARHQYNLCYSFLDGALDAVDTTAIPIIQPFREGGTGGTNIPTVTAPDILVVVCEEEVMHITSYVSGDTAIATVLRGQEGTVAAEHPTGARISNTPTKDDIDPVVEAPPGYPKALVAGVGAPVDALDTAAYVCDGTADQVQIQAAVDALFAASEEGGLLELVGAFDVNAVVSITDHYNLILRGWGESYSWGPNSNITRSGGSGAIFSIADSDVWMENLGLIDTATSGRSTPLVLLSGVNLSVDHCDIYCHQPTSAAFQSDGWSGSVTVRDSRGYMSGSTSHFISCPDGALHVELSRTPLSVAGYWVDYDDTSNSVSPPRRIKISGCDGNTSSSSPSMGIARIIGGSSGPAIVEISKCSLPTYTAICIDLTNVLGKITGCDIGRPAPTISNLGQTAIKLTSCSGGLIGTNIIRHAGHHGIWLQDTSETLVEGNKIADCSRATNNTYSCIFLGGNCDSNSVLSNVLHRAPSGNLPLYGVRIDQSLSAFNLFKGNDMRASCTTNGNEFSDGGSATRGYELRELIFVAGALSAPTISPRRMRFKESILGMSLGEVNVAPTGSSILVDLHRNGTTIYTTQSQRLAINAGSNQGNGQLADVRYIGTNSWLTVEIDQVGSTTPGEDLTVTIEYMPL